MSKYTVNCTWSDVAHLDEAEKKALLGSMLPHERDARSLGVPSLGSGAIYPVAETDVFVKPFSIPTYWPRAFALDVGWKRTAGIWGVYDKDSDIIYLYSEYYRGQAEPSVHAEAIKARGAWIRGVIDPASHGRGQSDGKDLFSLYQGFGLDIENAKNGVDAGILAVWQRLSSGRLKVLDHLNNWRQEFRVYRRDTNGKVVKDNDHLMDATRYLVNSFTEIMQTEPSENDADDYFSGASAGKSKVGGY